MRKLSGSLAVAVCVGALSVGAFAQAAAEAALTHGISSSAGSSIGTALGKATSGLAGRVGQQVSNAAPRQVITAVKPGPQGNTVQGNEKSTSAAPGTTASTSSGSLIASIEGAAPGTSACPAEPKAADGSISAAPASNPGNKAVPAKNCIAKPSDKAVTHPSEITLPPPK